MKKSVLAVLISLALPLCMQGQQLFVQTLGSPNDEMGLDLVQTADSGYVVTGSVSNGTENDMYLAKFDKNGAMVWEKRYGGAGNQSGTAIARLSWGGFVICGSTTSYGSGDVFITKTDENGDSLWTRVYGTAGAEIPKVIEVTAGGNYQVTGVFFAGGTNKPGVLTVDSNGVQLSAKFVANQFASPDYRAHFLHGNKMGITGGGQMLMFTDTNGVYTGQLPQGSLAKSIDACYLPGGYYAITHWADYGSSSTNCGLLLTDTSGTKIWDIKLTSADDDLPVWVKPDGHGGILVAISCRNPFSYISKMVVVSVDMQGNIKWQKCYNPGANNDHMFGNIISTLDGGYAITGAYSTSASLSYDLVLIKTDSMGNTGCDAVSVSLSSAATSEGIANAASAYNATLVNAGLAIYPLAVNPAATVNLHCSSVTMLNEVEPLQAQTWPNPVKETLHVTSDAVNATFSVSDIRGRIYLSGELHAVHEINVAGLSSGIYFLSLTDGRRVSTVKFVRE